MNDGPLRDFSGDLVYSSPERTRPCYNLRFSPHASLYRMGILANLVLVGVVHTGGVLNEEHGNCVYSRSIDLRSYKYRVIVD